MEYPYLRVAYRVRNIQAALEARTERSNVLAAIRSSSVIRAPSSALGVHYRNVVKPNSSEIMHVVVAQLLGPMRTLMVIRGTSSIRMVTYR